MLRRTQESPWVLSSLFFLIPKIPVKMKAVFARPRLAKLISLDLGGYTGINEGVARYL